MEPTPFTNTSSAEDPLARSKITIAMELFFCSLIILASFCGNILVIVAINRDSRLKTITNTFIQNLALTDISMALFHMPFWLISVYYGKWIFTNQICDYEAATMFAFGSASIATMAMISINRYFKIVWTQKYNMLFGSKHKVSVFCLFTWVIGVFFAVGPVYGWGVYQYHTHFVACSLIWEDSISFVVIFLGLFVNGITITIFICYYRIYKAVTQSSRNVASHGNAFVTSATDIKIMKSTFAVVCGYVCCWMPVSVVCFLETLGVNPPRIIYVISIYLMYTSSCINPVIYGILNPQFRKAFVDVFRCRNVNAVQRVTQHDHGSATSQPGQPFIISAVKSTRTSSRTQNVHNNLSLEVSDV